MKERRFLNSLTPKVVVVMIQEHKLKDMLLVNLGQRLMIGCASWILEATPRERSWLNPNASSKRGVGILIVDKHDEIVTTSRSLYDNRVMWIKLEGVEGGNLGLTCVYARNIPTDWRHLWHLMADSLPKDYTWIIRGGLQHD